MTSPDCVTSDSLPPRTNSPLPEEYFWELNCRIPNPPQHEHPPSSFPVFTDTNLPYGAMASTSAPLSAMPRNLGEGLHPSLLGIAAAMEEAERQRKQRMGLAQEFLGT
ncbi:hypothetical protein K3495_g17482, partial [Podosphaera aphanis]